MSKTAKQIIKDFEYLKSERGNWESFWQDLAKYCLPRKAYITRYRTPGEKLDADVYDSTAREGSDTLASGFLGFLSNPSQKWFTLALQNRELMDDKDVKVWLQTVEDKIFSTLNGSNFNQQLFEDYLDMAVFGTGTLYEEEDPKEIVRFSARPISEIFAVENAREVIDTVYRAYQLTAGQAFETWGQKAGKSIIGAMTKKNFKEKFDFIHLVEPRHARDVSKKDNRNMPFSSIFVNKKDSLKVSESGFQEFPFFVSRFNKVSGEEYGYSPAMNVWPDIAMINEMSLTNIKAGQLLVAPPLQLPSQGYLLPIKTSPNSLNYRNPGLDKSDRIEPLFTNNQVPFGLDMEDRRRDVIKRGFFADLFLLFSQATKTMTATEVIQRAGEKMLLLGPALGHVMTELLNPAIFRTFNILTRAGLLPIPPDSIKDQDYIVEYVSVLARAQKLAEAKGIDNFMLRIREMAEINPEVVDKVNTDKIVDELAKIEGITPVIVRDENEVKEIRDQRAAVEAQQQQLETLQNAANIAKTGSEANKNIEEAASVPE